MNRAFPILIFLLAAAAPEAMAVRIGEIGENSVADQLIRFFNSP